MKKEKKILVLWIVLTVIITAIASWFSGTLEASKWSGLTQALWITFDALSAIASIISYNDLDLTNENNF